MSLPNTYLVVPGLLLKGELEMISSLLQQKNFSDGQNTASDEAKSVKHNLQFPDDGSDEKQQIDNLILQAIAHSPLVQHAIFPSKVLPPLISKYEPDMYYGYHVDSPVMAHARIGAIRADVAMTLFLSDPETYEGGELSILGHGGEQKFKLAKGDAIIYPCTQVHAVLPVTSGVRLAAVTWMQCAVRDASRREILFQIKSAQKIIGQNQPNAPESLLLLQAYSNLMRMWSEI